MKTEIIPKVITLLAGAIVSIVCIINGVDVTRSLEFLLATLIIFYISRLSCENELIQNILISNSVLRKKIDKQAEEDIDEEKKEDSPSEGNKESESDNEDQNK